MNTQSFTISTTDLKTLKTSLYYLKVPELKRILERFALPLTGKKDDFVRRIITYLETGTITQIAQVPAASTARKGVEYPLRPDTLILKGSYKNDLETRLFFKHLIGKHFHFTAFGQDWIMKRWLASNPPTYQEFADMWQAEYQRRKSVKVPPKKEWKLIHFALDYAKKNPKAPRLQILAAWETERRKHVAAVAAIIDALHT